MLAILEELLTYSDETIQQDDTKKLATERAFHLCIEGIADVGNALIDGFIMRDPGSYTDIVEILRDEQVLTEGQAAALHQVVTFRKPLAHDYTEVPVADMIILIRQSLPDLMTFAPSVRAYVKKELF